MPGPLSGIRILDLTRVLAGPWATQNLADLGAEVIKIEKPGSGDDTRRMGPPFIHDEQTGEVVDAAYFMACNRNKESVTIDIATPAGRKLILALAAECDVLIKAVGMPELGTEPRFRTMADRIANVDVLIPMLEAITRTRTMADWVTTMEAVDVPCGPINSIDRVFADAQVQARGIRLDLPHRCSGTVPSIASPMRLSERPVEYRRGPPVLGEHADAVLKRLLHADDAALAKWRDENAI